MVAARIIETREVTPGKFEVLDLDPCSVPQVIRQIRELLKGARMAADLWGEVRGELDDTIEALNRRPPRLNPQRRRTRKVPEAKRL